MVQGINRQNIFLSEKDKEAYFRYMQEAKKCFQVKILAYCVMDNHVHVLLTSEQGEQVSLFFHRVNGRYAQYYNDVHNRVGPVFRDRFRCEVITDEKYLYKCVAYIHNNPLKAGLVKSAFDYVYSSMYEYINGQNIVDINEAEQYFDASADGIKAIMSELTDTTFLDDAEGIHERAEEVFNDLVYKYDITNEKLKKNTNLMKFVINEMQTRSNATLREISQITGFSAATILRRKTN